MRGRWQRGVMAAAAVGLVMTMTSCGSAPEGDALYRDGEKNYVAYSTVMHSVIMAIHDGEWAVDQGSYGVDPYRVVSTARCQGIHSPGRGCSSPRRRSMLMRWSPQRLPPSRTRV